MEETAPGSAGGKGTTTGRRAHRRLGETTPKAHFGEPLSASAEPCATVPGIARTVPDHPVVVALRASMLEHAVRGVLASSGWTVEDPAGAGDDVPRIVDDSLRHGPPDRTVLVCPATPVGCATALRRLTSGQVGAVVPDDRLTVIPAALHALRRRRSLLELDVIDLAALVPDLDARQRAVLEALLAGQSAKDIAASAYLSLATVKRTLSELFRLFAVRSALQLSRRASSLGYQPREIVGPLP
jgi:DNA-binding CsgD family transcriptional regulator